MAKMVMMPLIDPGAADPDPLMSITTKRLSALPGIFHASDALLRAQIPAEQLNQVLWRWKTSNYIKPLGPRADVWFNLVVDPVVTRERWEQAVKRALPAAILAGHGVLMKSGLSTQLAGNDYLIRPARSATAGVEGAEVHERPAMWIRKLWRAGAVHTESTLPELDPGAALADLLAFDPSTIDLDEIDWGEMPAESQALFDQLCLESGTGCEDHQRSKHPRQR